MAVGRQRGARHAAGMAAKELRRARPGEPPHACGAIVAEGHEAIGRGRRLNPRTGPVCPSSLSTFLSPGLRRSESCTSTPDEVTEVAAVTGEGRRGADEILMFSLAQIGLLTGSRIRRWNEGAGPSPRSTGGIHGRAARQTASARTVPSGLTASRSPPAGTKVASPASPTVHAAIALPCVRSISRPVLAAKLCLLDGAESGEMCGWRKAGFQRQDWLWLPEFDR